MKNLKFLLTNIGFWLIIWCLVSTIMVIWLSISYFNYECPRVDIYQENQKIENLKDKVNDYEKKILIQNTVIDKFDNDQLDSLWSRIH